MSRQWYPSRGERKAFAIRMREDKEIREAYQERKAKRAAKRIASSAYDYPSAGGEFVPTKQQGLFATFDRRGTRSQEDEEAMEIVGSAWSTSTKCHHDYIHRVNECMRRADNSYED